MIKVLVMDDPIFVRQVCCDMVSVWVKCKSMDRLTVGAST